ncbi:MAG TPA: C40 family peptidase, partial [Albitalea sp.]|nr:C40 family peptidase [Albitalea sp.]
MPDSHLTPRPAKQLCIGLMLALAAACSSAADPAQDHDPIARLIANKAFAGGEQMVLTALGFLGVPYRRGGVDGSAGFDCSGFTRHIVEASLGLLLPRRADEQASAAGLVRIARTELRPGDLVFFNTLKRTFSHVGIYIGDGKFIHAPRPGGEVRVE